MTAPLIPANVDLRDFPYMPLDVVRLRDSSLAVLSTGEEFRCAVLLWCASWHQVPAGSLPDDDVLLATLAGFGRAVREWKKVRDGSLRGWITCTDGRLYHPVVAEKAREAWTERLKQRWRTELARIKKAAQRAQVSPIYPEFEEWAAHFDMTGQEQWSPANVPGYVPGTNGDCPGDVPRETGSKGREGKGREVARSKEQYTAPIDPPPAELPARAPSAAGAICGAMRTAGLARSNPSDPRLLDAIDAGCTSAEFVNTTREALSHDPPKGFAWIVATTHGRRRDKAIGAPHAAAPRNRTSLADQVRDPRSSGDDGDVIEGTATRVAHR